MGWDFHTEPEFEEKLAWMRIFVRDEVCPLETLDLDEASFQDAIAPLRETVRARGLWAAHLDPDLGGQGFGQVKLGLMQEIIGRTEPAQHVFGTQPPDAGNSEILAKYGTEEQKQRWLAPLLAGRLRSAYAMTEPDAGADPTLLRCTAEPDGDSWVLNGTKWFVTSASIADFIIVMAVSDPDAEPHRRASQFIVPADTPGLIVVRELGSMHDPRPRPAQWANHAEVTLTDVRVSAGALLGERGAGFSVAQSRLGPGRIHHCMRWVGQAQRALDMMCERSLYRYSHGSVLAEKQTVQNWIADSWVELNALRVMTLQTAWIIDTQGAAAARTHISAIKFWGAKVLHEVIDRALQTHGSLGYSTDLPLEYMYRWARGARIYDGPDEIHRQSVAKRVLRGYQPPADGIPTEHVPSRRREAERRYVTAAQSGRLDESGTQR